MVDLDPGPNDGPRSDVEVAGRHDLSPGELAVDPGSAAEGHQAFEAGAGRDQPHLAGSAGGA